MNKINMYHQKDKRESKKKVNIERKKIIKKNE